MELSGKLAVGACRDMGFSSPPGGFPCQHQGQSLQQTDSPMEVVAQACTQECVRMSPFAWCDFPRPRDFSRAVKHRNLPRASLQSPLAQAPAGGLGASPGNFCRGTESAAFASLCPGPSMPSSTLTAPPSSFQPGHLVFSCPWKCREFVMPPFGKEG